MYRYFGLDAQAFLKDSKQWEGELKAKNDELESITEIQGTSTEHISGGGISKPTERTALQREEVRAEIARIEHYKMCFKYAWNCLCAEDVEILTGFYFTKGFISRFVDAWVKEHASNRQYCYNAKREAEKRFGAYCVKWMEKNGYDV